jgi:signal transduction histidine kinase
LALEIGAGLQSMMRGRRKEFRLEYASRAGRETRWFQARVSRFGDGSRRHFVVAHEDITEAKATEKALQRLAGRLLKVQDEERRRIARDLHDSTAQNLLGATLGISRALRLSRDLQQHAKMALDESRKLIEQAQREIRNTAYLLHPPMLDESGLPGAVRWYAQGFSKRSGVKVDINIAAELDECRLPPDVETALFRVVQEALTNVRRHSGSKKARILLSRPNEDSVSLTVEDNGRGMRNGATLVRFAADKPLGIGGRKGIGLASMSERLREIGGSLHIHSHSQGARITAVLPLKR